MSGIEVYRMYLSLKLHFTTDSYDYLKYGNAAKASQGSFDSRRDKFFFVKLARTFKEDELREFFVANMIVEDKVYPATLVREGAKNYQEYIKRRQSLAYRFKEDVITLHDISQKFDNLFRIDGVHPPLLKAHLGGKITLETLAIFNKIFDYVGNFDKIIKENIVWSPLRNRVVKYAPFINIDKGKYKSIIKEQFV
tara:strand:- start:775 stop:1359 length:585 start_codon:yes stop_codon:yes gene_type:complete